MIDVINTVERFDNESDCWRAIEQNPGMLIFQTFDWYKAAWECVLSKSDDNSLWVLKCVLSILHRWVRHFAHNA